MAELCQCGGLAGDPAQAQLGYLAQLIDTEAAGGADMFTQGVGCGDKGVVWQRTATGDLAVFDADQQTTAVGTVRAVGRRQINAARA
ncbi:hypothetical protein D3C80_2010010 [compost metagenome]